MMPTETMEIVLVFLLFSSSLFVLQYGLTKWNHYPITWSIGSLNIKLNSKKSGLKNKLITIIQTLLRKMMTTKATIQHSKPQDCLMYSSRLNTDYDLYHEIIKHDDIDCAKIIGFKGGDYGYIIDHNMSTSRGYKTVGDCKKVLFLLLDEQFNVNWNNNHSGNYRNDWFIFHCNSLSTSKPYFIKVLCQRQDFKPFGYNNNWRS